MYKLVYNPALPIECVIDPVWGTTENYLAAANKIFAEKSLDFGSYSAFEKDIFANLVRLSWMIQDLKHNRLQKPVLCDADLKLLQGGTRMMAVSRNPQIRHVAVLCASEDTKKFNSDWVEILDKPHLATVLGFEEKHILIKQSNWNDQPLDWIEFSLLSAHNHMHDENLRWKQITNYLGSQLQNFHFSITWLDTWIDWSNWASLDGQ